jgi:uncharacterized protein YbjT (DUF2867 family)
MARGLRTILVTGATGRQGEAVCRHLLDKGFALRTITRQPNAAHASRLRGRGIEVVNGDLARSASMHHALEDVWGVFAVQSTRWNGGEVASWARRAGVEHYVLSSSAAAPRRGADPRLAEARRTEAAIRSLGFRSHVILRPAFFMENLLSPALLRDDVLLSPGDLDREIPMVALEDLGKLGALAFVENQRMSGLEVPVAGDHSSWTRAAAVLGRVLGKAIEPRRAPLETLGEGGEDIASMLDSADSRVDIGALERCHGIDMTRLESWALRSRP